MVQLDDPLIEEFLTIHQEMQDAGEPGSPEVLSRHNWSVERWSQVQATIDRSQSPLVRYWVSQDWQGGTAIWNDLIAAYEQEIARANEERALVLREQLSAIVEHRALLNEHRIRVCEADHHNIRILQRWAPQMAAIGASK